MNIARSEIRKLSPPGNQRRIYWDDSESGFAIVQQPGGAVSYLVQTRIGGGRDAKQLKKKIGDYPAMTPEDARKLAREIKASAVLGVDIIEENKAKIEAMKKAEASVVTMEMAVEKYKERRMSTKKKRSQDEDRRKIDKIILAKYGDRDIRTITRPEIDTLHKAMADRPYEANRLLSLLSCIFNMAILDGHRTDNPVKGIVKFKEKKIQRYLKNEEAVALAQALDQAKADTPEPVAAMRLLVLTGARRNQVLTMRWEDVDIDSDMPMWRMPDTKSGEWTIPLNSAAVNLLRAYREDSGRQSGEIFSLTLDGRITAIKRLWRKIRKQVGFTQRTRLHDLRHSFASLLASRGVSIAVASSALCHKSITTTQRYAHLFDEALRIGVEKAIR